MARVVLQELDGSLSAQAVPTKDNEKKEEVETEHGKFGTGFDLAQRGLCRNALVSNGKFKKDSTTCALLCS